MLLASLVACGAPDYSPVREWAVAASLGTDYRPATVGTEAPPSERADAMLAIQEVLVTYFAALAKLADDGVLPFMENPFEAQTERAGRISPESAQAIRDLGARMRHATRTNYQAPQLRDAITESDPYIQSLIGHLALLVTEPPAPPPAVAPASPPPRATRRRDAPRDAELRQALADVTALRERDAAVQADARRNYAALLSQVAEGHALLKDRTRHLSQLETARLIRASEMRLRRASALLPRAAPPATSISPLG
ncbi:hypothetical protein [Roseococcus sp. YIM B11640]|uniref:hypothetical protein n=1 Tax=Roseococcus sp. YIM B11640 TaxID=3133973 RepID=UPI003C7B6ECB